MTQAHASPTLIPSAQFARAVVANRDALLRRARQLTHTEADAEDLLQETLLHAVAGHRTFRDGTNVKAWLFRILYNRWVSTHRYRRCRPIEVSVAEVGDHDLVGTAAPRATLSRSAEAEVLAAIPDPDIKAAMDAMPTSFQEAVFYADIQGYTLAETASILDVPVGTVMSRVSRGRQRLRVALSSRADDRRPVYDTCIA